MFLYRDLNARNMIFLSSEQALADLAYFIEAMTVKYEVPEGTKWIAFGGSYSGALAAWLRAKYPHLVHGAVSASAPLLAKADFRGMSSGVKCIK
jgi:pimeloyl-ACP methyl ester carboxylesterase